MTLLARDHHDRARARTHARTHTHIHTTCSLLQNQLSSLVQGVHHLHSPACTPHWSYRSCAFPLSLQSTSISDLAGTHDRLAHTPIPCTRTYHMH